MAGKTGMKKDNAQRWSAAIRLALQGHGWKEIAEKLGVAGNTVWCWRQQPEFQELLSKTQEFVLKEVANTHALYLTKAFKTECEIMENEDNSPAIRLSAAEILAKQVLDSVEMHGMATANQKTIQALADLQEKESE